MLSLQIIILTIPFCVPSRFLPIIREIFPEHGSGSMFSCHWFNTSLSFGLDMSQRPIVLVPPGELVVGSPCLLRRRCIVGSPCLWRRRRRRCIPEISVVILCIKIPYIEIPCVEIPYIKIPWVEIPYIEIPQEVIVQVTGSTRLSPQTTSS